MKHRLSKITSLLLAGILSSSILVSCGGGNNGSYDDTNFLANGTSENPYQIVKDPITITIFAPHSSGNPEYKDLKMFKYLSQITNINFNFVTPDTSAYSTVRSTVWQTANSIPDLFLFNNSLSEQVQFMEKGFNAYTPLNDDTYSYNAGGKTIEVGNIIDNYMPNYKKGLDDNFNIETSTNAKKVATLSDGKMYATLSVSDVARDLTYKMFLNQQWIDNLNEDYSLNLPNASDINTLEQYLTVLRAFKKYDANRNNDPDDEIPVTSKSLEYLRNFILESYGYVVNGIEIKKDYSTYEYVPYTEAYREYLKTMNTMFKEGLIQNSTFTITTDSQMAKYGNKQQLGSFVAAAAYLIVGYDNEAQYTTFGPLNSSYYQGEKVHYGFSNFKPDGAVIPTNTKYVREVARLIDIMYSDLGTQLISYGVENEDWTWDNQEKTSWTFNVPDEWKDKSQEEYRATITPNVGSASALYWSNNFVGKMNDEIITNLNRMSETYLPYLKVPEPYEIKMTSSEYDRITTIKAALDPQLSYLESSYITGDGGADPSNDASYNSFISKLKTYNVDEMLGYYNQALKRYNESK